MKPTSGITQRELCHHLRDLRRFGGVGFQKLAPRRQVVEEVGDFDQRAFRPAGLDHRFDGAAVDAISVPLAAPRARVRRRKCETDAMLGKASPRNPSVAMAAEVVRAANLARRMPLEAEPRIVRIHPDAIVFDANQLLAAVLDGDRRRGGRPRRWRSRPAP